MIDDKEYVMGEPAISEEEADEIVAICEATCGDNPNPAYEECDSLVDQAENYEDSINYVEIELGEKQTEEYRDILRSHKYGDDGTQYKKAMFEYCFKHNIPFVGEVYDALMKGKDDDLFDRLPHIYVETIKEDPRYKDITFFDQIHFENFEKIYSESVVMASLSEDDKRNRQQILNIIGYDPFEKNPAEDKPQLYRDLTGMLTDSMRKDIPRAKAAVEVVTGYNNIRKYQDKVNQLINSGQSDEDTQKQLDSLLGMITKIQTSVTSTSEKNGFSSGKTLGNNGHGMLSDVMNTVDEHMYDPGITNFYDIATSQSIQQIADISFKSMFNQVKLTGQEYAEMLVEQNKIVREAQSKMRELKEALRIAKSLIVKDKLIQQLTEEYRKKGISEEDIDEFISREYQMWDGK